MDFDSLTRPTSAFITFESDDSKEFALDNLSTEQLLYSDFRFEDASEPTDIIWENRNKTPSQIYCRQAFACTIIIAILALSFMIIFWISAYSAAMAQVFPLVDCDGVKSSYTDETLKTYAALDFDYIKSVEGAQSSGTLQCFCEEMAIEDPDNYKTASYGQKDGKPICGEYYDLTLKVYTWTTALSYLLIGFNYILREICIALIVWIGYDTETVQLMMITKITFVV